ncbi:MAG: DUF565 domain-containing protein [Snowella sp.]|nr:DUF565 domain-containing protein [Snowella sp.]
MQRTRLNTLIERTGTELTQFFRNPWRRISLILLGLLFGFFVGAAISTTAGQDAQWDVVGAALILLFTELISRFVYGQRVSPGSQRSLLVEVLNCFKLGVIYSLFLEAFKLGS